MAESADPNPVVFFDITLGGMPHIALYKHSKSAYQRCSFRIIMRCRALWSTQLYYHD